MNTGNAHLLFMAELKLVLTFDRSSYRIGEKIQVTEELANLTDKDVFIDGQSMTHHFMVREEDGKNIDEWPHVDIMYAPMGAEAFWKLAANETFRSTYSLPVEDHEWCGFGIPDGKYKGPALHVHRTAGESIYRLAKVPGKYEVVKRIIPSHGIPERAKKFGIRNAFSGELASPPVRFTVVP
jgi:hypothetical protein